MSRPKPQRAQPDPMLSVPELADYWNCSADTIAKMILAGDLPAVRIGPRMIRVRTSDADAVLRPVPISKPRRDRAS